MSPAEAAAERLGLRRRAAGLIATLAGARDGQAVADLAAELRQERQFDLLEELAERARTLGDDRPRISLYLAQALIDRDRPRLGADVLAGLLPTLEAGDPLRAEALGLAGRSWKDVMLALPEAAEALRQHALSSSARSYRAAFEESGRCNSWAGVNLLALAVYADRNALPLGEPVEIDGLAAELCNVLDSVAPEQRDGWHHATAAEVAVARRDLADAERHIRLYLESPATTAFALAGTLRQFTRLWCLRSEGVRGRSIVEALEAATLEREGGHFDIPAAAVRERPEEPARAATLQAILGNTGEVTYSWMQMGLARAKSVCAVVHSTGRVGTGFVVAGAALDPRLDGEKFVLTNRHVVSEDPGEDAFSPDDCHLVFEAVDPGRKVALDGIVWSSPVGELDATLLRVRWEDLEADPLPIAPRLPIVDAGQRVYVIGHPRGAELSFSLQDNELLEHEGPTAGKPPNPKVCKLHYRAPTEHGSSGSPVFNRSEWKVIALHHAGGEMARLNGNSGSWPANEGIWIQSIAKAIQER
ncbi:MAG: trypsin-like peptidase domain-containing protein [Alphaproteobacteria bacterium]|nr:MAG: trypsin-like peptidase domain-containing protein [Alphaproteobacteria bacterium]